jgi:hypothetical protein
LILRLRGNSLLEHSYFIIRRAGTLQEILAYAPARKIAGWKPALRLADCRRRTRPIARIRLALLPGMLAFR